MIWYKANRSWIAAVLLLALVASSGAGAADMAACLQLGSSAADATCQTSRRCCCGMNDSARACGCQQPEKPAPPVPAVPQEGSSVVEMAAAVAHGSNVRPQHYWRRSLRYIRSHNPPIGAAVAPINALRLAILSGFAGSCCALRAADRRASATFVCRVSLPAVGRLRQVSSCQPLSNCLEIPPCPPAQPPATPRHCPIASLGLAASSCR